MKPIALLSFLFVLLFAFTTAVSAEVVLDSNGAKLRNSGHYFFSPATPIGGGAIISAAIRRGDSNLCSLAVVAARYTNGLAVTVSSPYKTEFISTTFPLQLSFAYLPPTICTNSPNWVVVKSDALGKTVMVGTKEEFGDDFVDGSFKINLYDSQKHHYKLVFCEKGNNQCEDIGVKLDGEKRQRLVVTDRQPLVFKFDRADESFTDLSMVV